MRTNTRPTILEAALQIFSKNAAAPIEKVADAAGISRATFYRYFPSREALMLELTKSAYLQCEAAASPIFSKNLPGEEKLFAIIEAIIPMGDRYSFLMQDRSFGYDPEIQSIFLQDEKKYEALIEEMKADGIIAPDVPTAWFSAALYWLVTAAWSMVHDGHVTHREAPNLVYRTLMNGLHSN